jgi:hypothetical protein
MKDRGRVAADLVACFKAAMAVAENGGTSWVDTASRDRAVGIGMFLSSGQGAARTCRCAGGPHQILIGLTAGLSRDPLS